MRGVPGEVISLAITASYGGGTAPLTTLTQVTTPSKR